MSATIVNTNYVTYNYQPGFKGGINQHMSDERRARKQARHRQNQKMKAEARRSGQMK